MRIFMSLILVMVLVGSATASDGSGFRFDHQLHLDQGLACDTCHDPGVVGAGFHKMLPGKETCGDCHDVDDDCGQCHFDASDPVGYREREPMVDRFVHSVHQEQGLGCESCHGASPAQPTAPEKAVCRSCHLTAADYSDCSFCHSEGAELVPESHGPFWDAWHGVEAGHDVESCYDCHAQSSCQECHNGDDVRPSVHPLNYPAVHAIEARSAELECSTCHLDTAFCADCHRLNNVIPMNHSRANWAMPGGDGGEHAVEALFDLEGCIACHDTGEASPVCADCHGR